MKAEMPEEKIEKVTEPLNEVKEDLKPKKEPKLKRTVIEDTPPPINLTDAEEKELVETEAEVDVEKPTIICVVHKGPIDGAIYLCPHCQTYYCMKCASVLKEKGEKC